MKILCYYLKKEIIFIYYFLLWFCVFLKSQPSFAITGEAELPLAENVPGWGKKKKKELTSS